MDKQPAILHFSRTIAGNGMVSAAAYPAWNTK
jgi:hypothetical protein